MPETSTTTTPADAAAETRPSAVRPSDLARSFWRFILTFQISWNYERMQGLGFAYAMEPVLRRIYPDDERYRDGLVRHLQFFNSAPVVGAPLILGSAIALEESGSPTSADGVKVAMMGPLAGIGDTLTFAIYNSIVFTIGASLALDGNALGPILVAVLVLVPYLLVRRWQFYLAYRQGMRLAAKLAGGALSRFSDAATVLGLIVLGGFIPSIVKIVTTVTYDQNVTVQDETVTQSVALQEQLDTVLPFALPVVVTALTYVLLRRRVNPIWAIAVVGVVGLVLGWLGWFAPLAPVAEPGS